ncbi:hypothetical protein [Nakamurella deserti]|nr:hypothetical protein [Nakamurella deserti]
MKASPASPVGPDAASARRLGRRIDRVVRFLDVPPAPVGGGEPVPQG